MDWLDLLAVQGTLKSLLQHHSSKWAKELNRFNSSALSFFHSPTLTSIHDHRKNHSQCIYMEFRKIVMITLYARQQKRHRCIEQSFGLCGRGEDGMIWENSIETCILSYVKQITSPWLMYETGCSGLVHWDDPEGWDEEGGSGWGTHVHPRLIYVNVWQ